MLGTTPDQIAINDMIVNPVSRKAYLSVSRGRGPDAAPVILRVDASGKLEELRSTTSSTRRSAWPTRPRPTPRTGAATACAWRRSRTCTTWTGKVFIAGLSNEEFASKLRSVPFPFASADAGTSVEIYHGAHGQWETRSPVRTFVPYEIQKESHLLAAYTCTPLVKFPVKDLKPGSKLVGTTIAELGNRNRPLDMIVYKKDGAEFLLMSNSSRGVMKMSTKGIEGQEAITAARGRHEGPALRDARRLEGRRAARQARRRQRPDPDARRERRARAQDDRRCRSAARMLRLAAALALLAGAAHAADTRARITLEAGVVRVRPAAAEATLEVFVDGPADLPPILGGVAREGDALVFTPRFPFQPGMALPRRLPRARAGAARRGPAARRGRRCGCGSDDARAHPPVRRRASREPAEALPALLGADEPRRGLSAHPPARRGRQPRRAAVPRDRPGAVGPRRAAPDAAVRPRPVKRDLRPERGGRLAAARGPRLHARRGPRLARRARQPARERGAQALPRRSAGSRAAADERLAPGSAARRDPRRARRELSRAARPRAARARARGVRRAPELPSTATSRSTRARRAGASRPATPGGPAATSLRVATILEDLAGNSLGRPFEVDVFERVEDRVLDVSESLYFEIE